LRQTLEVWLIGATGLVGKEALSALLERDAVRRVVAFVRRPTGVAHPRLEERVVDFERLDDAFGNGPVDVAISCLGTTIKQAKSRAQFRRVDHDYVLAFGRAARRAGATRFLAVSSIGASARSLAFYSRVKGEVETGLRALGFPSLTLLRPSLLLGAREEERLGERIAAPFSRLLPGKLKAIEGRAVAEALAELALDGATGARIVESDELQRLGTQGSRRAIARSAVP
jgi:uncharacterized protein YbjT (DUF2867 family)